MMARAIHAHGVSRDAPFIKMDCSGPTPEDIELQLFGGLTKRVAGRIVSAAASSGSAQQSPCTKPPAASCSSRTSIELPARVQARLVRVLRDREAFVDDDADPVPLDVRPIASVDSSIEPRSRRGGLRPDLYERLSLIRDRRPGAASAARRHSGAGHALPERTVPGQRQADQDADAARADAAGRAALARQRTGAAEPARAADAAGPHGLIRLEDVLAHTQLEGSISPTGFDATLRQARARFERDYIAAVLQHQHGRIADAADPRHPAHEPLP